VQLIPDHKGVAVENVKKNCPMVVGRTKHNEEMAERSKTQIPEDKNNDEIRTQRRAQYTEAKTNNASKIRKDKSLSWREYCNMTTYINPWNEAYRLAAGKRKSTTQQH